ncbi:phage holin family protein [Halomonas salifodinae]|uniref:Phage holin family protein n=1 Tax=Halomonas salifodinae TaxID=438745 RepID=A0ABW2EW51_9GAMM
MTIAETTALIATLVIILRLLTYRRRGSRYRPVFGVIAWVAITACTLLAARIVTTGVPAAAGLALVLVAIAALLLRCRGDLAHLLRWRH